jgi:hypothetical protein
MTWSSTNGGQLAIVMTSASIFGLGDVINISGAVNAGTGGNTVYRTDYRQWQVDQHNLLFYRLDEQNQRIELLLLMDSRQNLQKLLFELMLLV